MRLMIVALELGDDKRKVIIERVDEELNQADWIVGYIPNRDDSELDLEHKVMGRISFREYKHAQTAFDNYRI